MEEIKGGLVIEQLKRYAEKLSDATMASAMVQIKVWCHRYGDGKSFHVYTDGFSCKHDERVRVAEEIEDLRELGCAIDEFIERKY
jgi:hypothetical protein